MICRYSIARGAGSNERQLKRARTEEKTQQHVNHTSIAQKNAMKLLDAEAEVEK